MQKQNLNVTYKGQPLVGFDFELLPLPAALTVACQQIDQAADQARRMVLVDPLRALEYQVAAQEAQSFASAGYAGDVPPSVQAWMDAAELDAQAAADSILAEAVAWKEALYEIRALRLRGKQDALKALSHAAAETIADAAIAGIQACIKGVGNAA